MKSHYKAVVIGGGVVGCSVLYHLARAGWTDIVLIERSELTSGSSWHAAGGFHTLNGDPNVAKLQAYTVQLYKELEEISGQSCSLHLTGGVMLADSPERMDFLRLAHAKGRYLGMDTELITPSEAKAMFPLHGRDQLRRRHVGPGRRPSRPVRHHASPIPRRRRNSAPRSCCATGRRN
jgi:dimethylglycine dehydrogenase